MDRYEIKAQVYPAVTSMIVPGVFIAYVLHDYLNVFNVFSAAPSILMKYSISILFFGAIGFFSRSIFRITSKYIFQLPFVKADESFMPTTNYLLLKDSFFSKEKKLRIYEKIHKKYNIDLSPASTSKKKEIDIRKKIAEAVSCIRNDFREHKGNKQIVENYNIQVGFFRNYLGGAFYACIMIAAIILLNGCLSLTNEWVSSVIAISVQLVLIVVSIIGLKLSAKEYAKSLIDYFDSQM